MKYPFFVVLYILSLFVLKVNAQFDTSKKANLQITLINGDGKPLINEDVIVSDSLKSKVYKLTTNQKGEINQLVSAGFLYNIYLKTLQDTTFYGNINIPGLTAKQFYTTPFAVEMVYEPAKQYTFHNLEFDNGKSSIRKESFPELNLLVEYLQKKTVVKVSIIGHTDNTGSEQDNNKLSMQRAEAVKNYVVKNGINASRISCNGVGSSQPIDDNNTTIGKQRNRRIELRFFE